MKRPGIEVAIYELLGWMIAAGKTRPAALQAACLGHIPTDQGRLKLGMMGSVGAEAEAR